MNLKMWMKRIGIVVLGVSLMGPVATVRAADGEAVGRQADASQKVPASLKVTVTISRFQGEKKTASLPFVLWVNDGGRGSMRMGSEVPVPTLSSKDGVTVRSYNYRSLGTNIDCDATSLGAGLYRLSLNVSDSQVFQSATPPASPDLLAANLQSAQGSTMPPASFQNFQASNMPILRDGETVEYSVATDKTNGEVIKLAVTLNVVK